MSKPFRPPRNVDYFPEVNEQENHTLCYITLVINLLCFFVYLSATGKYDLTRQAQVIQSVVAALPRINLQAGKSTKQSPVKKSPESFAGISTVEAVYNNLMLLPAFEIFKVRKYNSELAISILSPQIFGPNDDQLKAEALSQLLPIVSLFEQSKAKIIIDGFDNEQSLRGLSPFLSPLELTMARNAALYRFFVDNGVSPEKIATRAFSGFPRIIPLSGDLVEANDAITEQIFQFKISAPDNNLESLNR